MLVLVHAVALSMAAAPSFDSFVTHVEGRWTGASYTWTPTEAAGSMPLGVAPGYVTTPKPSKTVASPVMRSCGGAVQGVEEARETLSQAAGTVMLNRQADGTTFLTYGSWAQAPAALSAPDAEETDMMCSLDAFGISVSIAHADRSRRRLLVVVADGELACCDVAIEGHDDTEGSTDVADTLLSGRMQCIVEAKAWEGGASTLRLDGKPPAGQPWINARTQWASSESSIEGGAPLVPTAAEGEDAGRIAYLPGGCWLRIAKAWTTAGGDGYPIPVPGIELEVGSLAVEAGEVKTISHAFSAAGELSRVRFSKVVSV